MRGFTNSEIQTWKRCRRKWWFGHWLKLKLIRGKVSKPREVGSVVHRRIDRYYQGGMVADVMEELALDIEGMHAEFPDQEKEIKGVGDLSRIMLEGYFEWIEETGADSHLEVIAPEQAVEVEMPELGVKLRGKLDVRVRNLQTGGRQFLETKTVGSFADKVDLADMDEQLLEYHMLESLSAETDERSDGSILNMLRRVKRTVTAKPPFFMRFEVPHNRDELRTFYIRVRGVISDILHAESRLTAGEDPMAVVYPTVDRSCTWQCDYFSVCSMMNDPNKHADDLIELTFERHDPNARYSSATGKEGSA